MKEHYDIELSASGIRQVTMLHAQKMVSAAQACIASEHVDGVEHVIAEMDGCMVPVVEIDKESDDKRTGKKLIWKELKLCLAHACGTKNPVFGGTFSGGVEQAGNQLLDCAIKAGFGKQSQLHGVGDGAKWIADQVEEQFGDKGSYLIDLYHLCEYLSEAAPQSEGTVKEWVTTQKDNLKEGRVKQVIDDLKARLEPRDTPDSDAPVRRCYRYMINRDRQFSYKEAIKKKLPIGSGEIESAHRYIVQHRLKISGAWWKTESIDNMLALQLNRGNRKWGSYWDDQMKEAA